MCNNTLLINNDVPRCSMFYNTPSLCNKFRFKTRGLLRLRCNGCLPGKVQEAESVNFDDTLQEKENNWTRRLKNAGCNPDQT